MSWGYVAVAAGTVISAGISSSSSRKDSKKAGSAEAAQLEFEQERYDDWKATYGPIQDNLASYYKNLTPDYYEAQGLEAFQKEQTLAMEKVKSSLAQRGIQDSGIAIATEAALLGEQATGRAEIRARAPSLAAEEKRQFLQIGLGQNPASSVADTLAQRTQNRTIQAQQAATASAKATGTAISTVLTGLSDYLDKPGDTTEPSPGVPA